MKRATSTPLALLLIGALAHGTGAWAQQDRQAERNARRQQLQMQGLQQQLQAAQAEKARIETEKADLAKKLQGRAQSEARVGAAQRAAADKLKAADAERTALQAKLTETSAALEELRRSSEKALADKDKLIAQATQRSTTQQEAVAELRTRFGEQVRLVTECGDKNDRLARLGNELIDRYRKKGVIDAIRQREPALGLNDVEMFNLVQDWRDKLDAERFVPQAQTR